MASRRDRSRRSVRQGTARVGRRPWRGRSARRRTAGRPAHPGSRGRPSRWRRAPRGCDLAPHPPAERDDLAAASCGSRCRRTNDHRPVGRPRRGCRAGGAASGRSAAPRRMPAEPLDEVGMAREESRRLEHVLATQLVPAGPQRRCRGLGQPVVDDAVDLDSVRARLRDSPGQSCVGRLPRQDRISVTSKPPVRAVDGRGERGTPDAAPACGHGTGIAGRTGGPR